MTRVILPIKILPSKRTNFSHDFISRAVSTSLRLICCRSSRQVSRQTEACSATQYSLEHQAELDEHRRSRSLRKVSLEQTLSVASLLSRCGHHVSGSVCAKRTQMHRAHALFTRLDEERLLICLGYLKHGEMIGSLLLRQKKMILNNLCQFSTGIIPLCSGRVGPRA